MNTKFSYFYTCACTHFSSFSCTIWMPCSSAVCGPIVTIKVLRMLRMSSFHWCINHYCAHSTSCLKLQFCKICIFSVALATSNGYLNVQTMFHLNFWKVSFQMMYESLLCDANERHENWLNASNNLGGAFFVRQCILNWVNIAWLSYRQVQMRVHILKAHQRI